MFTAHDAGHRGITHNFIVDTLIGIFIGDLCCGLSIGWWKSSHNVHHLITNHPVSSNACHPLLITCLSKQEHDPDIQNVPLFATSPSFFRSVHSSYYNFTYHWNAFANVAVKYQRYTYYPVMCLARFNLYVLSWLHLLSSRSTNMGSAAWTRPVEIAGMLCYWFLFGYCLLWLSIPTWKLRVAFVLVSHIATMPLHIQITLSHWAMPTADLGDAESFPQRQLRTTMDIDCPEWLDFIHGGLQFQVVHHLFPRVPRHNLRKLQVLVREFCKETGIEYKIYGFVDSNKQVLGRLGEISKQVEMLVKCQAYMAETGESGLH
jgi:delta8-fatty-acid desaturase